MLLLIQLQKKKPSTTAELGQKYNNVHRNKYYFLLKTMENEKKWYRFPGDCSTSHKPTFPQHDVTYHIHTEDSRVRELWHFSSKIMIPWLKRMKVLLINQVMETQTRQMHKRKRKRLLPPGRLRDSSFEHGTIYSSVPPAGKQLQPRLDTLTPAEPPTCFLCATNESCSINHVQPSGWAGDEGGTERVDGGGARTQENHRNIHTPYKWV